MNTPSPTTPPAATIDVHDVVDAAARLIYRDARARLQADPETGPEHLASLARWAESLHERFALVPVLNRTRKGRPDTRSLGIALVFASPDGVAIERGRVPVRELVHAQTREPVDVQGLARALSARAPDDLAALYDEPQDLGPDVLRAFLGERPDAVADGGDDSDEYPGGADRG